MNEALNILDLKEFGRRCCIVRKKLGLRQTEMARQLGTTQHMISRIENGDKVMSPLIMKVMGLFAMSVSLNKMFGKEFDEKDDTILDKQYALNSVVKAKLDFLKEELANSIDCSKKKMASSFDDSKEEAIKQIDEASRLL